MSGTALLVAEGVRKSFGPHEILSGVDMSVDAGTVTCLLGPSGAGKSTFLRCINQLELIDSGRLVFNGKTLRYRESDGKRYELREGERAAQRRGIGMVFQNFNLFTHMTVGENLTLAPRMILGLNKAAARDRAEELLARVGLADKFQHYPSQLSGGQQQRVAIARALALNPQLMLFDEPTSALDPERVGEVLDVMRSVAEAGMTMIIVTHEIGFAREVANSVVFMVDGRVIESGPPSRVLTNPDNERTAQFLSKVL